LSGYQKIYFQLFSCVGIEPISSVLLMLCKTTMKKNAICRLLALSSCFRLIMSLKNKGELSDFYSLPFARAVVYLEERK